MISPVRAGPAASMAGRDRRRRPSRLGRRPGGAVEPHGPESRMGGESGGLEAGNRLPPDASPAERRRSGNGRAPARRPWRTKVPGTEAAHRAGGSRLNWQDSEERRRGSAAANLAHFTLPAIVEPPAARRRCPLPEAGPRSRRRPLAPRPVANPAGDPITEPGPRPARGDAGGACRRTPGRRRGARILLRGHRGPASARRPDGTVKRNNLHLPEKIVFQIGEVV